MPLQLKSENLIRNPDTGRFVTQHRRVGRNESCPCGSGKKFKACCHRVSEKGQRMFSGAFVVPFEKAENVRPLPSRCLDDAVVIDVDAEV